MRWGDEEQAFIGLALCPCGCCKEPISVEIIKEHVKEERALK